ncbi:MAG: DUF4157 domain-containing protein [Enhygromyxa sp.]
MRLAPLVPKPNTNAKGKVQRKPTRAVPSSFSYSGAGEPQHDPSTEESLQADWLSLTFGRSVINGQRQRTSGWDALPHAFTSADVQPQLFQHARSRSIDSDLQAAASKSMAAPQSSESQLLSKMWAATPRVRGFLPKLEVGSVDDPLEVQAERIAERVMSMPETSAASRLVTPLASEKKSTEADFEREGEGEVLDEELLETSLPASFAAAAQPPDGSSSSPARRACSSCKEEELQRSPAVSLISRRDRTVEHQLQRTCASSSVEESLQRACSSCQDEELQRACSSCQDDELHREPGASRRGGATTDEFGARVQARERRGGRPLDPTTRRFFESRLGRDLRSVRIYTDPESTALARAIDARAFTHGQHVFFGSGEYRPTARSGLRLIAHELVHTLQSRGHAELSTLQRAPLPPAVCPISYSDIVSLFERDTTPEIEEIRLSTYQKHKLTLRKGDSGKAVGALQAFLLHRACGDGAESELLEEYEKRRFGKATKAALMEFQAPNADAAGTPLDVDGVLGPKTISAIDERLGLEPIAPDKPNANPGSCMRATAGQQGPGYVYEENGGEDFSDYFIWNFDIDDGDLKAGHVEGIDELIVPGLVEDLQHVLTGPGGDVWISIEGLTSSTGTAAHNKELAKNRATCVRQLIRERLTARLTEESLEYLDLGYEISTWPGEKYSQARIDEAIADGQIPSIHDIESPWDRAVVVSVERSLICSKHELREPSTEFSVRLGCLGGGQFSMVISHQGKRGPITREFKWSPINYDPTGCSFYPIVDPNQRFLLTINPGSDEGYRLATGGDPGAIDAESDFEGLANMLTVGAKEGTRSALVQSSFSGGNARLEIPGALAGPDMVLCDALLRDAGALVNEGILTPVGPAQCKSIDDWTPTHRSCDNPVEAECSDLRKGSTASRFMTTTVFYHGVNALQQALDKLGRGSDWAKTWFEKVLIPTKLMPFSPIPYVGLTWIQTLKTDAEKMATGGNISQMIAWGGMAVGDKCAIRDTGNIYYSQFDTSVDVPISSIASFYGTGTIAQSADSNKIALNFGNGALGKSFPSQFEQLGKTCAPGPTWTGHMAWLASPEVVCAGFDEVPYINIGAETCKDDEDCPERLKTCGARQFIAKFGRMDESEFGPELLAIRRLMGCDVAAARVNIQTFEPIPESAFPKTHKRRWRPFVLIARATPDPFEFKAGTSVILASNEDADEIRLTTEDKADAPSDLTSAVLVNRKGIVGVGAGYLPKLDALKNYYTDRGALFGIEPAQIRSLGSKWDQTNLGVMFPIGGTVCEKDMPPPKDTPAKPKDNDCTHRLRERRPQLFELVLNNLGDDTFTDGMREWGEENDGYMSQYQIFVPPKFGQDFVKFHQVGLVGIVDGGIIDNGEGVPVIISGDYDVKRVEHQEDTCAHVVTVEFKEEICAYDKHLRWHRLLDDPFTCENTKQRKVTFIMAPVGVSPDDMDDPEKCWPTCASPQKHGEKYLPSANEGGDSEEPE